MTVLLIVMSFHVFFEWNAFVRIYYRIWFIRFKNADQTKCKNSYRKSYMMKGLQLQPLMLDLYRSNICRLMTKIYMKLQFTFLFYRSGMPKVSYGLTNFEYGDSAKMTISLTPTHGSSRHREYGYWVLDTDYESYAVVYSCEDFCRGRQHAGEECKHLNKM